MPTAEMASEEIEALNRANRKVCQESSEVDLQSAWDIIRDMKVNIGEHGENLLQTQHSRLKIKVTKAELLSLLQHYISSPAYKWEYEKVAVRRSDAANSPLLLSLGSGASMVGLDGHEALHIQLHTEHGCFQFLAPDANSAPARGCPSIQDWGAALHKSAAASRIVDMRSRAKHCKIEQQAHKEANANVIHSLEQNVKDSWASHVEKDRVRYAHHQNRKRRDAQRSKNLTWHDGDRYLQTEKWMPIPSEDQLTTSADVEVTVYEYQRLFVPKDCVRARWESPEFPLHRWSDAEGQVRYCSHRHDMPDSAATLGYVWSSPWQIGDVKEGAKERKLREDEHGEPEDDRPRMRWTSWEYAHLKNGKVHQKIDQPVWMPLQTIEDANTSDAEVHTGQYQGRFFRRRDWHRVMTKETEGNSELHDKAKPERARCATCLASNGCKLH